MNHASYSTHVWVMWVTMHKLMSDKEMVQGLPNIISPTGRCEGCLVRKQTWKPYADHTNFRAKKRLELIHGDLCGPISPPTPAGNRYFFVLVDDFSRVMWIYLLQTKDQTLGMFKKFRAMVEAETGERIRVLQSDRGGGISFKGIHLILWRNRIDTTLHNPVLPWT